MNTYDDEEMRLYIAEEVKQIMMEQRPRRKRRRPLFKSLTGLMVFTVLLAGMLTLVLLRAFADGAEPPAARLPAATWTSIQPDTISASEPAPEPVVDQEPVTVALTSRYAPVSEEDIELMARIVHLESNNQVFAGQQAVAECILNRVWADNFPDTVQEVVYADGQFTTAKGAARAVPTLENYMAVMAALYGKPVTPIDVVYFNGVPESRHVWAQIGDHVFCYQYPWAYENGQYNDMDREEHTVIMTIYNWKVHHPDYGTAHVTACNRYYAVLAAAQDWGVGEKMSLFAECDVECGEAVMSTSPEPEDEAYG